MSKTPQIKKIKYAGTERYTFGKIEEKVKLPYLIGLQKEPYKQFVEQGIGKILEEISPIEDYSGKAELHFLDYKLEGEPKYSKEETKKRRGNYTVPLKVKARLIIKETGEVIEQDVFMGDIPLMSEEAYFIVNGVERVVVSQIVKSAGVYFSSNVNISGKKMITASLHSPRGTRFSVEQTKFNTLKVILNNSAKLSAGVFLKGCGFSGDQILDIFNHHPIIEETIKKEAITTEEEALFEIGRKTRPSDIPSVDAVKTYLNDTWFSNAHYNFGRVGRYKFNKKLSIASRVAGLTAAQDIKVKRTIVAKAGEVISQEAATKIQNAGINEILVSLDGDRVHKIIGNARVPISEYVKCDAKALGINEMVYYPLLKQILKENKAQEDIEEALKLQAKELVTTHLTIEDILASVSYMLDLNEGLGHEDNIDHLGNRRVATVGELLGNEFRKGVYKLRDTVKESLQSQDLTQVTPNSLVSARPVNKFMREFLSSGQLSQITEDFNPAASITNKRRLSAVGPGGLKKERAGMDVRDIHYSHYGRICAIETPEGPSIGLINGLASYARINEYGFIETPYRKVNKDGKVTDEIVYMMADEEEKYYICQAVEPLNEDSTFVNDFVLCRNKASLMKLPKSQVSYMDSSPRQFISSVTSLVPFLENNYSFRAQTASNMQRQAVPLLRAEAPIVATGIEATMARDSGAMVLANNAGEVTYVDARTVIVTTKDGKKEEYTLSKLQKTNKETSYNQRPAVVKGQKVKAGDVLADGYSTDNGELAVGKNVNIAFMNWEGYNYEDAILISERLVKEDTFTSIVLKVEECDARNTKLGDEEITRDIPNVSEDMVKNLDENGIVRIGAKVGPGDYLVGKVTPKGETELTPEERLLRAIFGEKARDVRDNSLKVPHGGGGVVVDVQVFTRKNKDELDSGVNTKVKVYIAKKRKISVGDKMAGRHGNKGVISRVLPVEDMPFMPNGDPVDVVLNPLGVPSRMNIGQVLEVHLGLIAKTLGWKVATPSFNGCGESDIKELFKQNNMPEDGKYQLYDGRSGEAFENKVTIGQMYMIKLEHMSEAKIHARSTGSYQLITRQPLGGKAMFGGQKFGEMEVWALEAYGASHLLQEMLTVKSDDVVGRQEAYKAIVEGKPIPEPGVPGAFKVLVKELQAIGLDAKVLTENNKELSINEITSEEFDDFDTKTKVEENLEGISLGLEEDINDLKLTDNDDAESEDIFDESTLFDDFD